MLLAHYVKSVMNEDLIVHVNPQNIKYYVGSNNVRFQGSSNEFLKNLPRKLWFQNEPFNRISPFKVYTFDINERDYAKPKPIESIGKYQKIENFIKSRSDFRKSTWYKTKLDELTKNGATKYKNITIDSSEKLDNFFEKYVLGLINSMETEGYIHDKGKDLGNIMINEDGTLHKSNAGDHRFFVSKLVGVKLMPFKIKGVHGHWLEKLSIPKNKKGLGKLSDAIKKVEKMNQ